MSVVAARNVWSRAVARLDAGTLSESAYRAAAAELSAISRSVRTPERSRVELYLDLLQEAWRDHVPGPLPASRGSDLLVAAHRALASGFADAADRAGRRRRARTALRELERLAAAAGDETERLTIVRLADPLLRLLSALDTGTRDEVLQ